MVPWDRFNPGAVQHEHISPVDPEVFFDLRIGPFDQKSGDGTRRPLPVNEISLKLGDMGPITNWKRFDVVALLGIEYNRPTRAACGADKIDGGLNGNLLTS